MKKIFLGLFFSFLSLTVFAEKSKGYMGGHFSVPLILETVEENGIKNEVNTVSIGFGMDELVLISGFKNLGYYLNLELIIPMSFHYTITNGSNSHSYKITRDNYTTLLGFNTFLGISFNLFNENNLFLAVSPGISYTMLCAKTTVASTTSMLFGAGINIQGSLNINDHFCLTLGMDTAFDFLTFSRINNGDFNSTKGLDFIITPKIGFGYIPG